MVEERLSHSRLSRLVVSKVSKVMYCDDEITAARKMEMWSEFSGLINTAFFICEELEEQHRLLAEKEKSECRLLKILAEEEEESRKRIFCNFPKKLRSSLQKPNLYETSDYSSKVSGLNQTLSDSESIENHLQWLSSHSNMETLQNPNAESCSLPLLVECNTTDESEKTERETPEWLVQVMENTKGSDAKLIFEKSLFVTDVNRTQNRLSMPYNSLIQKDFLTDVEKRIIEQDIRQKKKTGVDAILVNQQSKEWEVKLKRWEMKKDKENGSWNYSLVVGWNKFVKANGLKEGDNISVWSFRSSGDLYFALEKTI